MVEWMGARGGRGWGPSGLQRTAAAGASLQGECMCGVCVWGGEG